jgi:stage II sporulation protein E
VAIFVVRILETRPKSDKIIHSLPGKIRNEEFPLPGVFGLPRQRSTAVPGLKRSRWTQLKASAGQRLRWLWHPSLYASILFGVLLGRALGASNLAPFGIAFYAAVRGAGYQGPEAIPAALAVLVGAALAVPERFPWVALSILTCHLLAPVLRVGRSGSSPLSAAVLAAVGVALPAAGLYARTNLVMLAFWIGFTGIVALVFTMGMSDTLSGRLRLLTPGQSPVPAIILLAAAICGLMDLEPIRGFSVMEVAAGLVVLGCAYAGGAPVGAAAGAVLAVTQLFTSFKVDEIVLPDHMPLQSMAYVVGGMLGGTFRELRKVGTGLAFGLGLVTYAMVTPLGPEELAMLALSTGASILLFWVIPASWVGALPAAMAGPPGGGTQREASAELVEPLILTDRITGMSRALKEISRTLEQVAAVSAPQHEDEVAPHIERVTNRVCRGCSMFQHCWERQREATNQVFTDLWAQLGHEGQLNPHNLPEVLEEICIKPEQIVTEINYLYDTQRANSHFERKLEEGRAVVVDYLKNVSRMMDRFVDEVGQAPGKPRHEAAPMLRAVSGVARLPKKGGHISGDSYAGEPLGPDRYLLALSDGMGVGRAAAMESRQCVNLLREILKAGFATDVAVKTVNSALLLHSPEESFATVDLALLDLTTGRAEFVKVGAAPSFIIRGRDVSTVKASSVPVGIINQVQVEPEFRNLRPDDIVVMITDGVWDVSKDDVDKERWILEHLRRERSDDPEEVAESLLARALELMPDTGDDLTVLAARIDALSGAPAPPERRTSTQWAPVRRAPRLQPRPGDKQKD